MIKKIFHFLGGLYFALMLIGTAALLVIVGTLLEARFDSHLYAVKWIYGHPFFTGLLCLFFINILFAALRRWPFKTSHIPFLLTHLGLLMIIAGTIVKNRYGIQGSMLLLEGSGSQQITLPHTYALHIEKKNPHSPSQIQTWDSPLCSHVSCSDLKIKVLSYTPHVSETLEAWIKGEYAFIKGLPPIPVQNWQPSDPLTTTMQAHLNPHDSTLWDVVAIRTDYLSHAIQHAYLHGLDIKITPKANPSSGIQHSLSDVISHTMPIHNGTIQAEIASNALKLHWKASSGKRIETIKINLQGNQALYPILETTDLVGTPSFHVDLIRSSPLLLLIEDLDEHSYLYAFDQYGRIYNTSFPQPIVVYDRGFGGYATQSTIPFPNFPAGRQDKENADLHYLAATLREALKSSPPLSPPLQFLKKACDQTNKDFVESLLSLLKQWDQSHSFLLLDSHFDPSFVHLLSALDWKSVPERDRKACDWACLLLDRLERPWREGEDIRVFLKTHRWPFLADLSQKDEELLLSLTQQMLAYAPYLPNISERTPPSLTQQARLLSAYFLVYGLHYHALYPFPEQGQDEQLDRLKAYHTLTQNPATSFIVEAPLTLKHRLETPLNKLEDNCPRLFLEVKNSKKNELASLTYDPSGNGLKWPILNGEYTIRFQPQWQTIPYRIRLRQARQINYANSNQPYSYESDVMIQENGTNPIEKTLSMNQVYETWDGFRFYLAGMSTSDSGIKRVQIVVNYDPAKYYLTYPGGIIVALGIILLFWCYKRNGTLDR